MSEEPPKRTAEAKRKFWQFHLSTAIVLLLTASLIMWIDLAVVRFIGGEFRDNMAVRILDLAVLNAAWLVGVGASFEGYIRRREARKI